jgi:hypothetical protein
MTPEQFAEILKLTASKDTSLMACITVAAIFLGPIIAVFATRYVDNKRDDRQRKFQIFKDLMVTRSTQINYEHVKALNAIEIEFFKEEKIISAWKKYFECLCDLSKLKKITNPKTEAEINEFLKIQSENLNFNQKKQALFTKLIHEIAKTLKINIEQLDILAPGYVPQGWFDEESEQRLLRQLLIGSFSNKGGLPIMVSNLYPPVNNDTNKTEQTNEESVET